jgi:acetyl-CoA acetyltransferase
VGKFEDAVVISGIGQSQIGRRLGRSPLSLTMEAIRVALDDAGLAAADVDGLATYPGGGTAINPGFAGPALAEVYDAMGFAPNYLMGSFEGPAQLGPVLNGCLAINAGLASHVVVYRTVTEGSARRTGRGEPPAASTTAASTTAASTTAASPMAASPTAASPTAASPTAASTAALPPISAFGGAPPPVGYALLARRHFHAYGTSRVQLGQIALTARRHAQLNPHAILRDPLTLTDYLAARIIDDPLCLYDCDIYCDGSTAIVLSVADYGPDAPNPGVQVEAFGIAPPLRSGYAQHVDLLPGLGAAQQMWARTDLAPADVDVAGVYDGFSILTMLWLEALGFCGRGESGPFVEGGTRISIGGDLPINTNGGQLSGGRLHGLGFVHEMCLQLRGAAGARQVEGAGVAVVAVGALPYVGCMLLRGPAA